MTRDSAVQSGAGGGHVAARLAFQFQGQCFEPQPRLFTSGGGRRSSKRRQFAAQPPLSIRVHFDSNADKCTTAVTDKEDDDEEEEEKE